MSEEIKLLLVKREVLFTEVVIYIRRTNSGGWVVQWKNMTYIINLQNLILSFSFASYCALT